MRTIRGECCFESRVDQLVHPKRSEKRIASNTIDQVFFADEKPALRAAQQFIAAGRDQVAAARDAVRERQLAVHTAAGDRSDESSPLVYEQGQLNARAQGNKFLQLWLLHEAFHAEIRLVHTQYQSSIVRNGALIVGNSRPVGCPHFFENCA